MSGNIIIANTTARWGLSHLRMRQAQAFFEKLRFPFSSFISDYPGHAQELAEKAAAEGAEAIIALGGDGTVHEVINGVLASGCRQAPAIGIIPSGSSNDFSKSVGIPQRLQQTCRTIISGKTKSVDIGQAGTRYFCMASSLGYLSDIAAESVRMKGLTGPARYLAAAMKVIARISSGWQMSIQADQRELQGTYGALLVTNTPRFGGLTLKPDARLDDGKLDCLLVEMIDKRQAVQLLKLALMRKLTLHEKVTAFQATSLSVSLDRPALVNNDGEVSPDGVEQIDYRIMDRKLRVIC